MRVDNVYLAGIATYLPDRVEVSKAVELGWFGAAEAERSGLLSVTVGGELPAPDMAIQAAKLALKQSGHSDSDIDTLYHSSVHYQGPDVWSAPHYILRNTLGTPISAKEIRHGCLGMVAGMEIAAAYLSMPGHTAVLLTTGDNFSTPIVDRWKMSNLFVLADGGAAAVLSNRGGFAKLLAVGSVSNPAMEELHRGGEVLFPPGITVGDKLDLEKRRQYWVEQWGKGKTPPMGHLGDTVAAAVNKTLGEAGLTMDDITRVAHVTLSHGPLKDTFLDPLGIDEARGVWEFTRTIAHAGPVDHIAGLEHLWTTGQVGVGDHVLLVGATPGAEAACAVLEILETP